VTGLAVLPRIQSTSVDMGLNDGSKARGGEEAACSSRILTSVFGKGLSVCPAI
jgi:hypothetical protein